MSFKTTMSPMSIIIAVDECGGFGKDGKIPWHFKEDFKHFQKLTKGNVCIMGRKTYEDMLEMRQARDAKNTKNTKNSKAIAAYETVQNNGEPAKPPEEKPIVAILPERQSFVVTSNPDFEAPGATVVKSIRAAVQSLPEDDTNEIFILGGLRMFIESLSWVNTIYLTLVKGNYKCDRFFPVNVLDAKFKITEGNDTDELSFITYKRK